MFGLIGGSNNSVGKFHQFQSCADTAAVIPDIDFQLNISHLLNVLNPTKVHHLLENDVGLLVVQGHIIAVAICYREGFLLP